METRSVVKNAGWIIGARVVQMLLGLFVTAWTARFLGPSNIGVIDYVDSYTSFFLAVASLGLNNTIVKSLMDHKDRPGTVLGTAILMRIISSALCSVVVVSMVSAINHGDRIFTMTAVLLSLAMIFQSFEMFNYWYQSKLESRTSSIIQTIAYVVVAAYRIFCLISSKNVLWFAFANSLDSIVIAVLLYITYKRKHPEGVSWDSSLAKEMLSKSHHFIWSGVMVALYSQMDKIMIKGWMDTTAVGYYGIALGINSMWGFVLQAIIDSMYPTIVEAYNDGSKEEYHSRIRTLYATELSFSAALSLLITILAKPIILILYGEQYLPSVSCLRISTWINTFAYLGVARGAWMVCEDNQLYQKYILGIGAVTNLILNSLMIPKMGIYGAAFATVITQIMTSTIAPLFFKATRENTRLIMEALKPSVLKHVFAALEQMRKKDK